LALLAELLALDVRVGTVVAAERVPGARSPLWALTVDFGAAGRLPAVVDADGREAPEDVVGLQVAAVLNVEPRRVAGFESRAWVLALRDAQGESVLLLPERPLGDDARLQAPEET
jgi:tRNA-binding protein